MCNPHPCDDPAVPPGHIVLAFLQQFFQSLLRTFQTQDVTQRRERRWIVHGRPNSLILFNQLHEFFDHRQPASCLEKEKQHQNSADKFLFGICGLLMPMALLLFM